MIQITPFIPPTETSMSNSRQAFADFCNAYQTRELALLLISQLNHLVKDVQRHRGISMGLLAGNRAFEREFCALQKQIDRRMLTLDVFTSQGDKVFSTRDRGNFQSAWTTIRHDWQDDKLSDNFELHSHFIEQLLQSSAALAKTLETPLHDDAFSAAAVRALATKPRSHPRQVKQIELLSFVCALLPTTVENLAKIRGLASFAAAVGAADYDHDRKLRFFLRCAREQNDKLRHRAQRLQEVLGGELNAKVVVGELEVKFSHLIEIVTHDVLSGKTINSSASQLFNLATVLIDKYWGIVDDGLDLMRAWHRGDLENWMTVSPEAD